MANTEYSDEELVLEIIKGNQWAFEAIYDRYATPLYNFFFMKLGSKEKAEDLLQNIFLKLIEKANFFDEHKSFKTWFYTLAHNLCKNEYRTRSRSKVTYENIEVNRLVNNWEKSSERIDASIFSEHLSLALKNLNENQQTSFILRFKYNLSIKEISDILGCSEGTTKSRIFYTLKQLANDLKAFNPY